ncbi:conjugal transfer protein TrbL family protein [Streptosporangium saharense]|uniref:conjugal transfer protein TrbL family protein n=1 Tax=Streptosporangium saharense TaxID=1706840 RepID=UPI0036AD4537
MAFVRLFHSLWIAAIAAIVAAPAAWAEPGHTPSPSPSPSPSGDAPWLPPLPSAPGTGFGIGSWIGNAITTWFADLVTMAIKPLLDLLAVTLLATPSVERQGRIWDLCQATTAIANGAFVMFVVVGGMLTMTYETVQSRYAIKEILPRLVVAFLAANASFVITAKSIDVANALSAALLGQGFDARRAANAIKFLIIPPGNSQIFYILLALVAVILLVLLLITFVLRAALTSVLVIAAPLALACVALPQTEGLARLWWRGFSGLLLIQICQSLTLVTAVRIFFNQDGREAVGLASTGQLYNLLLALVLLIILVRIPGWVSRTVFLPGGGRSSMVGRIVKTAIAYKLASPVLNVLHLRRGGGRKAVTGAARGAAAKALVGRAVAGAATGGAGAVAASTAASAARGGDGPAKHAPVAARKPVRASDWEPGPVKHAPSAPPITGKYRPTPTQQTPAPRSTPVYGNPRETFYADGPAGLAQMYRLRNQGAAPSPTPRRSIEPPPTPRGQARPIVSPNAPIPGTPEWPENPGAARRTPPPPPARRRRGNRRSGGDQR